MAKTNSKKERLFSEKLVAWFDVNGRSFPWRTENPYCVLVSEVFLQQTNVRKVVEPYNELTKQYPSIFELSEADDEYLAELFKPLGLFYRADRLISIAKQIMDIHEGEIPDDEEALLEINGIGKYSANSILCFGYNKRTAILDTNIIRIFSRFFGLESEKSRPRTDKLIWSFAETILPKTRYKDYNYALLDYAALVCAHYNPKCSECVLSSSCTYIEKGENYVH